MLKQSTKVLALNN